MPDQDSVHKKGLGTNIIATLAKQLKADVTTESSSKGASISISHSAT